MATAAQRGGRGPRTFPTAVSPEQASTGAPVGDGIVAPGRAASVRRRRDGRRGQLRNDYSDEVRGTDDQRVGPLRLAGSKAAAPARPSRRPWPASPSPRSPGWPSSHRSPGSGGWSRSAPGEPRGCPPPGHRPVARSARPARRTDGGDGGDRWPVARPSLGLPDFERYGSAPRSIARFADGPPRPPVPVTVRRNELSSKK